MPDVYINLDPCNPGQCYACCGLIELFELQGAQTRSHFELDHLFPHKATFVVETETAADLAENIALLANAKCEAVPRRAVASSKQSTAGADAGEPKSKDSMAPLLIHLPVRTMTLDWWLDEFWSNNSDLKLWAGNQSSLQIWTKLCDLVPAKTEPAMIFETAEMAKGRFGVDPRSAWEALDLGYSPNEQNHSVRTYPPVEVLAAIGLQGFRPKGTRRTGLGYCLWLSPLPAIVARTACMQPWEGLLRAAYAFRLEERGSYKYFSFAERAISVQE